MENFDALGIHTGESVVVAPSQTLTDSEYHKLRTISIDLIRHLGVVGECNVQFALHPSSEEYRIIEVNARLSRSSALASKATGYPLAFVAAKLGLGYSLMEVPNSITKETTSCFEPALDYVVVKYPRWDLKKFRRVSTTLGTQMKSVGEVMAIGRCFEEALQKATRMVGVGVHGVVSNSIVIEDFEEVLKNPTEQRVFAIAKAFEEGMSLEQVHELSKITPWFLSRIQSIVETSKEIQEYGIADIPAAILRRAKEQGSSDNQVSRLVKRDEALGHGYGGMLEARKRRQDLGIFPVVKQIDTLAAEYPAQTNYLYMTYNGDQDDVQPCAKRPYIVLGSGAYRIGSSVEFDWCCVNAVQTLNALDRTTIMINFNPETVSTDYDSCDRLYFEELSLERVLDIAEKEQPDGVLISMGGQIPNNLAVPLSKAGLPVLGTSAQCIDRAENRERFSSLLDDLGVDQPEWQELTSLDEAKRFAEENGFPVLVRPSYVLSGAAMSVAHSNPELEVYLKAAAEVSKEFPVVLSKFILNAKEIEFDAVANKGELICYAISEHVENAGVHSGDATMVFPSQRLYLETIRRVKKIAKNIAKALEITGPFNIQFVAKENEIKVIECNLRASRSFPFVSKVLRENFIDYAVRCMLGHDVKAVSKSAFELDHVGVKAPQFSFSRLKGADPLLGVEMASTGEVACFGDNVYEAYLKSVLSVGFKIPEKAVLLAIGSIEGMVAFLPSARSLVERGLPLYATESCSEFFSEHGVPVTMLECSSSETNPLENSVFGHIQKGVFDLVVNIPAYGDAVQNSENAASNDYRIRRCAVDYEVSLFTNVQAAVLFVDSITKLDLGQDLRIKAWDEYFD